MRRVSRGPGGNHPRLSCSVPEEGGEEGDEEGGEEGDEEGRERRKEAKEREVFVQFISPLELENTAFSKLHTLVPTALFFLITWQPGRAVHLSSLSHLCSTLLLFYPSTLSPHRRTVTVAPASLDIAMYETQ